MSWSSPLSMLSLIVTALMCGRPKMPPLLACASCRRPRLRFCRFPDHYHKLAAGVPWVDQGTTKEISEGKPVNFDIAGYQHSWLGSAVGFRDPIGVGI